MHVKVAGVRGGHKLFLVFILGRGGVEQNISREWGGRKNFGDSEGNIPDPPPPPPPPPPQADNNDSSLNRKIFRNRHNSIPDPTQVTPWKKNNTKNSHHQRHYQQQPSELQWLEHLWNHESMFETGVVRAKEC